MPDAVLETAQLAATAGTFRLGPVDLHVAAGECHAILGPSGSGKSTVLRAILGLLPSEQGRVRLRGNDLTGVPVEQRGLGYVPQRLGLFPHLTVRENVAYSAKARRVPDATFEPLLDRLVEATGIGGLLDRRPSTLSGGERQRVGLVRAMASQPGVVLLDEPFTALDETLRRELWRLLRDLRGAWDLTVLLVTHDLAEAHFLADRVTVLLDGRVEQQGEAAEVFRRPATPAVARLVGVENLQRGRVVGTSGAHAVVAVGGARLRAPLPAHPTEEVWISLRGGDVSIERGHVAAPADDARNELPARVVAVEPGHRAVHVELDAGFPLVALLSHAAAEALRLHAGLSVTATVRTGAVHLMPHPGERSTGPRRPTA